MCAEDRLIDILYLASQVLDQLAVFFGCAIADGVGKIHGSRAFADDRFGDLCKEINIRSPRVFGRELYVLAEGARISHAFSCAGKSFFTSLVQFVFEMDITGGEKDMDAGLVGS